MTPQQKEFLVYRILSGCIRCSVDNTVYVLTSPSISCKYKACEIYEETLEEAKLSGHLDENELWERLKIMGIWSNEKEDRLKKLSDGIDDLKVQLYNCTFKSKERKMTRMRLNNSRQEIGQLLEEKHQFDYSTSQGVANLAKHHYIILSSLTYDDGTPVYPNNTALSQPNTLYEPIISFLNSSKISESQFRELARTDPWRAYWGNDGNLFGKDIRDFSDEQVNICAWSRLYDNVHEHPECPHNTVVEDDDMLDGWLIIQKRKRESEQQKKEGEELISKNPKIANAGEIFIPAETIEDARKIDELNDAYGKALRQQKMNLIKQKGEIKEQQLPDVKQQMIIQATQQQLERQRRV